MRILNPQKLAAGGLADHEKFFIQLWFSMTHMHSSDSYRVRCMNARMIVREMVEELHFKRLSDKEFRSLCEETFLVLDEDPILDTAFPRHLLVVKGILGEMLGAREEKKLGALKEPLSFALQDMDVTLRREYFPKLCGALPPEVRAGNEERIRKFLSALLTDLVDRGWTLEALFGWHGHFCGADNKPPKYSFQKNLEFMLRQFNRDPEHFEVVLRLSGSDKLMKAGTVAEFTVSQTAPFQASSPEEVRLARPNPHASFAQVQVDATDHLSAAFNAREEVESWIDLLRYDFEHRTVTLDDECYVKRMGDGRVRVVEARHSVPNPPSRSEPAEFERFCKDIQLVSEKSTIQESSRRLLQRAIRQYRFGRDSQNYKDKFLNWWFGLESLCYLEHGNVGEAVRRNASHLLVLPYLHRLVRSLLSTLQYCRISWTEPLKHMSGAAALDALSPEQFIAALQSPDSDQIWAQCSDYPILAFYGKNLAQILKDPQSAAKRVARHLNHLEWQLDRLYRIRCCIVHGSDIRFRLALPTSHLEFYLKSALSQVLQAFKEYEHLKSLEEIFSRASNAHDRMLADLNRNAATPKDVVRAVFTSLVIT